MRQSKDEQIRYEVNIYGIVQGVGFRPFIYNCARELELKGYVNNIGASVFIDIEGSGFKLKSFINKVVKTPPPLSQIEGIRIRRLHVKGYKDFEIVKSSEENGDLRFVPKDIAICQNCKKDILDVSSRWSNYVFTNCTDCGPRYSIMKELPYDRCNTSMGSFELCPECKEEYDSPSSRRFHAQPVCCPECGPQLSLLDNFGKELVVENAVKEAARLLKEGKILGVKGIGGFHLMCDAENKTAVANLRSRKRRPHQPFAVMAADLNEVEHQCIINDRERQVLTSNQSPIVLLRKSLNCSLPEEVAPDTDKLGMMLPYTPLHMLLLTEGIRYLIATSGNISGMPIEYQNIKAVSSLKHAADYFLLHNRDINIPIDDSVIRVNKEKEVVSRIGRGYAPASINIGAKLQLIALGAEQKSSICLSQGGYAHVSQYLGDIKNVDAYENFKKVLNNLIRLMKIKPQAYVHDLHPSYMSTQYALEQREQRVGIQHHFAHMASCIAEHKLNKPVIGVIYDGTGFGEDGKVWGGEILVGTRKTYIRAGHLKCCSIQGGDKAAEEPWRTAVSYLYSMGESCSEGFNGIDKLSLNTVEAALRGGLNCYESSSMGRMFDCISVLLGLCSKTTYDAQAAILLEHLADKQINSYYEYEILMDKDCILIGYEGFMKSILRDVRNGRSKTEISSKFHNTIVMSTVDAVIKIGNLHGVKDVVLSGGCFENLILMEGLIKKLEANGFTVYFNEKMPCNDGGISFGQLAAADQILRG